jgi:hypothetical protein
MNLLSAVRKGFAEHGGTRAQQHLQPDQGKHEGDAPHQQVRQHSPASPSADRLTSERGSFPRRRYHGGDRRSADVIQRDVEDVEVPQPSRQWGTYGAIDQQGDPLLRDSAVRA